ncbi:NRT2 ribosyltransferase, partial [Cnemophilus loriae]|nr:NRT2 ribosyltransferase [Cnemophilus loriae]
WPLPSMAPLAQILALLAMTVATTASEVVSMDMAPNSFDDQYLNCGPAMTKALPRLKSSELQENKNFSRVWEIATAEFKKRGSSPSPLTQDQATALMAYTMRGVHEELNDAVREAGRSHEQYRDNFHFKALHFLLTNTLQTLRNPQQCHDVFRGARKQFTAHSGDTVRFGQFTSTSLDKKVAQRYMNKTMFQVRTCHGVDIQKFSYNPNQKEVLVPPF